MSYEVEYVKRKVFSELSIGGFVAECGRGERNLVKLKNTIDLFMRDMAISDDKKNTMTENILCFGQVFMFMWNCSEWYKYSEIDPCVRHATDYYKNEYTSPRIHERVFSGDNGMKKQLYDAIGEKYFWKYLCHLLFFYIFF